MSRLRRLVCMFLALATPTIAGTVTGAVIQGSDYDTGKGMTTLHILNVSGKEITAFDIAYSMILEDGTVSATGWTTREFINVYMRDGTGFAPGTTFDQEMHGRTVTTAIDFVVYADGTAEVVNNEMFQRLLAWRKGEVEAKQEITKILQAAVAGNADRPSVAALQQLEALLASSTKRDVYYKSEITETIQNLHNISISPTIDVARERAILESVITRNQIQIPLITQHTQIVTAGGPGPPCSTCTVPKPVYANCCDINYNAGITTTPECVNAPPDHPNQGYTASATETIMFACWNYKATKACAGSGTPYPNPANSVITGQGFGGYAANLGHFVDCAPAFNINKETPTNAARYVTQKVTSYFSPIDANGNCVQKPGMSDTRECPVVECETAPLTVGCAGRTPAALPRQRLVDLPPSI